MDSETKGKLEVVLARKAELESAARTAQQERERAAQRKEAERKAVRDRWDLAVKEIDSAIAAINAQTASANLELSVKTERRATDHPGLAQLSITLTEDGQSKERRLVLNVSALGLVQPVVLIPHSGPKIADFNISDAGQAKYEAVIVEFLDFCFAPRKAR